MPLTGQVASINREGYESLQSDITRTIYVNREPVAVEVAAHQSERYGYNYIEDQNELSRFEGEISLGGTRIA